MLDRGHRAAAKTRFHNDHQSHRRGHQTISPGKLPRLDLSSGRTLRNQPTAGAQDPFGERVIPPRSGLIDRRREHRDGIASAVDGALVGSSVNPEGQPRHDTEPLSCEPAG
jgi:hypothetical protein